MTDRDRVIEDALATVPTPEHRAGFWADLDNAIAYESGARPRRAARTPVLAVAAALAVVLGVTAIALRDDTDEQTVQTNQPATTSSTSTPPTTAPPTAAVQTPDQAVLAWLNHIADGEFDEAAAMVGPRSADALAVHGGTVDGMVRESQEGHGAWPASPDLSTTEVDLSEVDGDPITIVVVSGTWTGEGATEYRTQAYPVVRYGDRWLVEAWAMPFSGQRLEVTYPAAAGDDIEVTAPGRGRFFFSLDDGPVRDKQGTPTGTGVRATFTAPSTDRSHLVVVAYFDGDVLAASASVFPLENQRAGSSRASDEDLAASSGPSTASTNT